MESPRALDEAEAARDGARARLKAAEAHLAAAEASQAQGGARLEVAQAAAREAEAGVRVRAAAREQAAATYDKTFIRAPFDGVVVLKDAEVGEVVSPNSQAGSNARGSVATMVDFGSLEVQAEVPETSLAAVRIGGPVRIFLDAHPDRPYAGKVERIWPTANRQKATVEVRVAFAERDERLRPEMGVRVVFLGEAAGAAEAEAPAEDMLLVPSDALVRRDGGTGVFVLEGDVARFRGLVLGARRANRVAVAQGLAELPARGHAKGERAPRLPRLRAILEGSSWALRGPALAVTAQPDAPSGAPAVLTGLTAARFAVPVREEEPAPRRSWWRRLLRRGGKRP